jgi:hypothetical protein
MEMIINKKIISRDQLLKIVAQIAELAGVIDADPPTSCTDPPTFFETIIPNLVFHHDIDFRRKEAFLKAELAVRSAKQAILALDKRDQVALRRALYHQVSMPCGLGARSLRSLVKTMWNRWPEDLLFAFSSLTGNNPVSEPANGNGRGKGAVSNWQLQSLVEGLWEAANLHGGTLYADHKREDGGTMIRALELLRPVLPEGLLPEVLPTSTIENIIKNFKASGKTWTIDWDYP